MRLSADNPHGGGGGGARAERRERLDGALTLPAPLSADRSPVPTNQRCRKHCRATCFVSVSTNFFSSLVRIQASSQVHRVRTKRTVGHSAHAWMYSFRVASLQLARSSKCRSMSRSRRSTRLAKSQRVRRALPRPSCLSRRSRGFASVGLGSRAGCSRDTPRPRRADQLARALSGLVSVRRSFIQYCFDASQV